MVWIIWTLRFSCFNEAVLAFCLPFLANSLCSYLGISCWKQHLKISFSVVMLLFHGSESGRLVPVECNEKLGKELNFEGKHWLMGSLLVSNLVLYTIKMLFPYLFCIWGIWTSKGTSQQFGWDAWGNSWEERSPENFLFKTWSMCPLDKHIQLSRWTVIWVAETIFSIFFS